MTISGLIKSQKWRFALIFLLFILVAGLNTAASYFFKPATDALVKGNLNTSLSFFVMMIGAGIISIILDAIVQTIYSHQVQDYIGLLRQKIVHHFYQKNDQTVTEMQNELGNNFDMLTDNYATPVQTLISNSFTLIFTIGVLAQLNWTLVILTAILAILNLLTPRIMEKATSKANQQVSIENSKLLKTIDHWLGGIQELRRYSSFSELFRTMNKTDSNFEGSNIHSAKVQSLSLFISSLANTISQIAISLWAGVLFFQGKMTIGAALVVGDFASQIFNAIWIYEQAMTQLKSVKSVNEETKKLEKAVPKNIEKLSDDLAELDINDLDVKYEHGEEIHYPNIKIKQGEKVLLTGDSSTGKSTLFKVILGQLKPKSGTVVFKDSSGKVIKPDLGKIGYIAQDSILFPESIQNNITMFNSALDSKVEEFVEKVQLKKDILKFPDGLETAVDLDKDNLSGGQKQKVVLARSQIHHSKFVLMDEATSAIDSEATKKILQELLKSDVTLILIAHNFDQNLRAMFDREIHLKGVKSNDN
ncbi:ABC transporter ATP-binding protein [Lactobacillus helveticus]|uniref:ATP-binding cassette domain-containing protein n=1 Tax=Lactobacillus helveticus TaxID=1587 RepID=UPI0021820ABA|nr:ABC transporter ATP-binding protein [Lactobacillus helveticus]MCT0165010.1 ABC transporter ATP-binding protein [Lactobacillus helveticus]MCT0193306.1 ABC transporter ATP-binding protein [Lactobacillus helveticus]